MTRLILSQPGSVDSRPGAHSANLPFVLLLQAACLDGQDALRAWRAWRSQVALDEPGPGVFSLLPLLYHNLRELAVSDPWLPRLKGIYLRNWSKNQVLFEQAAEALSRFRQAGIETCAVNTTALALADAENRGRYYLEAFEVVTLADQAASAIGLLRGLGWSPAVRLPEALVERYVSVGHRHWFRDSAGNNLYLHWRVLSQRPLAEADREFLADSVEVQLHGAPLRAMRGAGLLLHLCAHDTALPVVRAASVWLALEAAAGQMDWPRALNLAHRWRLTAPLQEALQFLGAALPGRIPREPLERVQALPVPAGERLEFRLRRHRVGWVRRVAAHWLNYRACFGGVAWPRRLLGFPVYLQHLWRLERLWQIPLFLVFRGAFH